MYLVGVGLVEVLDEDEKRKVLRILLSKFDLRLIHYLLGIKIKPTDEHMVNPSWHNNGKGYQN